MKSEKQRLHLEKLHKMQIGRPSPRKGRKFNPFTLEQRKRMSEAQKKYFKTHPSPRKGIKCSEESKRKMSESAKKKIFSKSHRNNLRKAMLKRWSKIPKIKHTSRFRMQDMKLKNWKNLVFKRDNWICQLCGKRGGNLEAHHKKGWAKYPKLRYKLNNGITLCYDCHKKVDPYRN